MIKIKFKEWDCFIEVGTYVQSKRLSLTLFDELTYEPIATCTVNVDEVLDLDEVAIKNYSENEGMLDSLIKAKIISEPLRYVNSGFVTIPICKLLINHEQH